MKNKGFSHACAVSFSDNYKNEIIYKTYIFVRQKLEGEGSGHDWWHIDRVWKNSINIAKKEKADLFVVQLAALLHDIADWKFCDGDETVGPKVAKEFLQSLNVEKNIIDHICTIIKNVSFKGAKTEVNKMFSIEGKIVQDADRLDALGAIGIARVFAYGGYVKQEIYNPEIKPKIHTTSEEYKKGGGTSVNHFYEKLLLLKDLMNTKTGKELAQKRHEFIETYLDTFYKECEFE